MTSDRHAARAALSQDTCRARLSRSRRGFLACTRGALPTVMPVDLQLEDGQLVVSVHDPSLSQQLMGQVVALSVGRQALWFRRGWTVTALGRLGSAETEGPDDGRCLPFEVAQLEGLTFVKHSQPITKGPSRVHG